MIEESKIREISNEIKKINQKYIEYVQIYKCTDMLLKAVYGNNSFFEDEKMLIINIRKIANELGIEIIEQPLEKFRSDIVTFAITMKYTNIILGTKTNSIMIESDILEHDKCFMIAMHIYYNLKYHEDKNFSKNSTVSHLKYNEMEEIIAQIFARMLLLPPLFLVKEFSEVYKGESIMYDRENEGCIKNTDREWYNYIYALSNLRQ